MPDSNNNELIRSEALRLGFDFVGFARAERLDEEARRLEQWLHQGAHGQMAYMENHFDMRVDPTLLVPGAKTVICLAFNYHTEARQEDPDAPKISQYAYGVDYHFVVKEKLKALFAFMQEKIGEVNGRCFVDSAPVLERAWAHKAGLGWNGRHTLTIHPKRGSYFFLAEIICDLPLLYDDPLRDHCGTCRRCIDACPTQAIAPEGYFLDAARCISYLTIELRAEIPESFAPHMENWMFGCDICQQVCPWNRFARPHEEPQFEPHPDLLSMRKADWQALEEDTFSRIFKKSAVKRIKFEGLKRNIQFLKRSE
ncbi:MAG: tRNA epoxyqueuosine(34) reductase QueG [Bacteroidetes bacterium]|nr:tRNA epoxyqueuosine(34) reductase QueG [Bacteroidota bacterium]